MHSIPPSGAGEPAPGQSDVGNGEACSRKRKRAGLAAVVPPVDAAKGTVLRERMYLLSRLNQKRPAVDGLKSIWKDALEVMQESRPHDILFALLYSIHETESAHIKPGPSPGSRVSLAADELELEGLVGVDSGSSDVSSLCQAISSRLCNKLQWEEPMLLQIGLTSALHGAGRLIAHDAKPPADDVVLCPIFAHDTILTGALLLGVSAQSYDDDFAMFVQVLSENVGKSVTACRLRKKLRDIQHASGELLRRADEAERSNFMFRHMAESATVGCAIFDPTGHPMWLNEAYINLTGVRQEDFKPGIWQRAIAPEDLSEVESRWKKLAAGESIVPFTFRVKRKHSPTAMPGSCESQEYRWLLSNAYVDFNEDGSCRRVMGWLTDISAQKLNENMQAHRLADALETKRQTEKFIDMVSHEIRNPLSAIIQTADGVLTSMDHQEMHDVPIDIRNNILDAGKTIVLCAHHQKRIVDDILTLSKLDSNLLVISPNPVRPHELAQNAMKMFEAELSTAQIEASISVDESYKRLSIESVLLDESRVLQILLNLITNAIKFTRRQSEREVIIRLAASQSRPSVENSELPFVTPRVPQLTNQTSSESGLDEILYVIFAVEDTGPGLSKDEMKSLFQRFAQASPKTYRGYGGFGLGLFICRELAELQGGQIGLSSVLGQGTTFTFYVQAQRCKPDSPGSPDVGSLATADHLHTRDLNEGLSKTPSPLSTQITTVSNQELDPQTLHILVVEDNKINQTVLVRQLRLLGCTVYVADHGLEALELLSRSSFQIEFTHENSVLTPHIRLSVILMDLEMPVMDGLTCVRRIRQMEAEGTISRVPVIATTANARSDQISRAMEAGMDSVVTKPFRIPELIQKIAAVIKNPGAAT